MADSTRQLPQILAIVGATASGKSGLAMALAERYGAEILSVDSMQIYRCMDVGTAKPSADEKRRVRHHLVDIAEPTELFTVARFVDLADAAIADASRRNVPLIAVGGTPMYFKALFHGLFDGPEGDDAVRARLESQTNEQLYGRLVEVDPASRVHANDRKRLIRAVEVFELTGQPLSSLQNEWADPKPRHTAVWIGLDWERDELNRRINARVRDMLSAGWLEETRLLNEHFGVLSKTASMATGYQELLAHLNRKQSLDDAVEQIKISTRQLARRQMKWFRRFEGTRWLAGKLTIDELVGRTLEFASETSGGVDGAVDEKQTRTSPRV